METAVILECGHVEVRDGRCETTDCANFVGVDDSWHYTLPDVYRASA